MECGPDGQWVKKDAISCAGKPTDRINACYLIDLIYPYSSRAQQVYSLAMLLHHLLLPWTRIWCASELEVVGSFGNLLRLSLQVSTRCS